MYQEFQVILALLSIFVPSTRKVVCYRTTCNTSHLGEMVVLCYFILDTGTLYLFAQKPYIVVAFYVGIFFVFKWVNVCIFVIVGNCFRSMTTPIIMMLVEYIIFYHCNFYRQIAIITCMYYSFLPVVSFALLFRTIIYPRSKLQLLWREWLPNKQTYIQTYALIILVGLFYFRYLCYLYRVINVMSIY